MTEVQHACPDCDGPQMHKHPAGPLTFQHTLTCPLRDGEDATQHADLTLRGHWTFNRRATNTERRLIRMLDPTIGVHAEITIRVERLTPSVRHRTWTARERVST